mgnify:CR=1 FL=1
MASNFISTYNLLNGPRLQSRAAQVEIARLGKEIVDARHADVGLVLGAKSGHSTILYQELKRVETFVTSNGLTSGRLDVTQSALTEIRTAAETTLATLVGLPTNELGAATIKGEAERTLKALTEKLNSSYAGQRLFSGVKTDTEPMNLNAGTDKVQKVFAEFQAQYKTLYWDVPPPKPGVPTVNDIVPEAMGIFLNRPDPAVLVQELRAAAGLNVGDPNTPEIDALSNLATAVRNGIPATVTPAAAASGTATTPPQLVQNFGNVDLSLGGQFELAVNGAPTTITFTSAADLKAQLEGVPGVASAKFGTGNDYNVLTIVGTTPGVGETLAVPSATARVAAHLDGAFDDYQWGAWSSASDTNLTSQISQTESVDSSVNANNAAFRQLAKAYALLGALPADQMNEGAFKAAVDHAIKELGKATNGVTILQADLGATQTRVKTVNEALATQKLLLQRNLTDLEGVDPAEAKVQLDTVELQLSLSYALTARLQNLNLLNYVR